MKGILKSLLNVFAENHQNAIEYGRYGMKHSAETAIQRNWALIDVLNGSEYPGLHKAIKNVQLNLLKSLKKLLN
jgi:hypothetical protein